MSVLIMMSVSLILFWVIGSKDFAINMSIFFGSFILLEAANLAFTRKTISQKFHRWSQEQPRWKVWVVSGAIVAVGVFMMMHLAVGW